MVKKKSKTADQIRKEVTGRLIEAIKQGTPPWRRPWNGFTNSGIPCNFQSKRRYTGINPIILMWYSMLFDFQSRFWGTANSWLSNTGAHVKKGEAAAYVTLFRFIPKKINGKIVKDTKGKDKKIPLMREFAVFNVAQLQPPDVEVLLDGRGKFGIVKALLSQFDKTDRTSVTTKAELMQIASKYLSAKNQPKKTDSRESMARRIHDGIQGNLDGYTAQPPAENIIPDFEPAEALIKASGAAIMFGGNRAFYTHDYITIPPKGRFESMATYYETLFHELIHWTEKADRVGRKEGHTYAFGELVAEIGASFLSMELGVPLADKMLANSQSYVAGWLAKMGDDTKFVFDAATQAGKAVDFLLEKIGRQNPEYVEEAQEEVSEGKQLECAA